MVVFSQKLGRKCTAPKVFNPPPVIFSRHASLTRQAFLITPLLGAIRRGRTLTPKSSTMQSYVKLMRRPQH